jgi:hypothetical protein
MMDRSKSLAKMNHRWLVLCGRGAYILASHLPAPISFIDLICRVWRLAEPAICHRGGQFFRFECKMHFNLDPTSPVCHHG